MLSRRGFIPTIVLVIFSLLLVGYALFVFASYSGNVSNDSEQVSSVLEDSYTQRAFSETVLKVMLNDSIQRCVSDSFIPCVRDKMQEEALRRTPLQDIVTGKDNIFAKIRNGQYSISGKDNVFVFEVDNVMFSSKSGKNEISGSENYSIVFDLKGILQ